ncbi:hypothetical protein [Gordonia desulfuricans]|uniref:hypothetical protein n=1 Tax=Gordonia desulfuricans TaxID=89051 RepID=UPI00073E9605|nr:hypothetical protein [Gordonia desulfuricans]
MTPRTPLRSRRIHLRELQDHFVDVVLGRAVQRVGAPTDLQFTQRQLYYEVCRTLLPVHRLPRKPAFTVPAPVSYRRFCTWLERSDDVPGLLHPRPARAGGIGCHTPEPDLYAYGLPRILCCQSQGIAEMLRANGLPMESACLVVGVDELPLSDGIIRMLGNVDDGPARVYVLHDDSPTGAELPGRIRELASLPDSVQVVPIGLRRGQSAPLHLTRTGFGMGSDVEVAAVAPAMLLRSVHRLVREMHRHHESLVDIRGARSTGFLTWPQR